MKAFVLLPLRIVLLLLLAVVLPQVWLLGVLHGFIERVLHPTLTRSGVVLPPFALSEAVAHAVLSAHEQALREGRQPWH